MPGEQFKTILEDVWGNLFNPDPYYQQGGDMVRVGGLSYVCAPTAGAGQRVSDLKLANGRALDANKSYKVSGWASVNEQKGEPVWDVFTKHLRSGRPSETQSAVTLRGVENNPGIAGRG